MFLGVATGSSLPPSNDLGGASFVLDFLRGPLDPSLTFTRSTAGWRVNENGIHETIGANTARFDCDPGTHERLGLLMEPVRTNSLLYARDLTQIAWVKTNMSIALDAIGIDAVSNSASTATATAGNATILQSLVLAAASRSYSVYVRRKTGVGSVEITRNGGTSWTDVTSSVRTNSWTRVSIKNTSVLNPVCGFRLGTNGDAIYVDMNQDEDEEDVTSPISTTTIAVTRDHDYMAVKPADFAAAKFNPLEGTVVLVFATANGNAGGDYFMYCENEDSPNSLGIYKNVGDNLIQWTNTNSVLQEALGAGGTLSSIVTHKVAARWKKDFFGFSIDGGAVLTDISGTMSENVNSLVFGGGFVSGANTFAWLKKLTYFPSALNNAALQTLSA
jgi:hypothetical protein